MVSGVRNRYFGVRERFRAFRDQAKKCFGRISKSRSPYFVSAQKSLIFLILSLWAGNWAAQWSQVEALATWQREHPPSLEVWNSVFQPARLRKLADMNQAHRFLRYFQNRSEAQGSVWLSHSARALVLFDPQNQGILDIYSQMEKPTEQPKDWLPMGSSWDALTRVQNEVKKWSLPAPPAIKKRGPTDWKDLREIRF